MRRGVFAHVLTYKSADVVESCVKALLATKMPPGDELKVVVTDNASGDGALTKLSGLAVSCVQNSTNLGFSAGHNQALGEFLREGWEAFVTINPDLIVQPDTLPVMLDVLRKTNLGAVTPKLLRTDADLRPVHPPIIDAAGMLMNNTLRHLDRGSGEVDRGQYDYAEEVFGGTGACLMFSQDFVKRVALPAMKYESDADQVYPQLKAGRAGRALFFDEAFFAYREDAELAWRAQLLGFGCAYCPQAVAHHRRAVVPENRSTVSELVNRWSVRNRFLMQIQNLFSPSLAIFLCGAALRNIIVIGGVLLRERKSLGAFRELALLFRRALERRKYVAAHRVRPNINDWCRRGSERVSRK
jgi:GT2 family glycosyltransferase